MSSDIPERVHSGDEAVVISVEPKGSDARQVSLDEGSFFLLSAEQCLTLDIREHAAVSIAKLTEAHESYAATRAVDKALSLIGSRDHSKHELIGKLEQRGFSHGAIDHAVSVLESYGYLDDERFAKAFVRERLRRRPEGRIALAAGLARRGIPRRVAERVLSELVDEETERDALRRAGEKLSSDGRSEGKLANALQRRGFPAAMVKAWIRDSDRQADTWGDT